MSRYVKNLITEDLSRRLEGVDDAVLVNVIGMDSNSTYLLRKELREKNIRLLVVKNSMARRATDGSPLNAAFHGTDGCLAVTWGCEDFISLTKEITRLVKDGKYKGLETRGGVMDGEHLSADRVEQISKWPNREEQLSILLGQILSPGAQLQSQLLAAGGALASQIEQLAEKLAEGEPAEDTEPAAAESAAAAEAPAAEPPAEASQ
jgi:large subunit ribosomal protein L10